VDVKLALKAARLPVVAHKDGRTFTVGGDHQVYVVGPDWTTELRCPCKAGRSCSHLMAIHFYATNDDAMASIRADARG
jgi:hypothetical protein